MNLLAVDIAIGRFKHKAIRLNRIIESANEAKAKRITK